jgi:tRNA threonylcarbamoyladenosine biosynthesis protein TsaB
MNCLALDTSSSSCSIALKIGNDIHHLIDTGPTVHAQRLLAMIDELLSMSDKTLKDIDLLVCGIGPGSFTGLRIGVGTAQGLAYSTGVKVLPLNSLLAYLSNDLESGSYGVGCDARMGQMYNAGFRIAEDGKIFETIETVVCNPEDVNELFGTHHVLVGSGWDVYREALPSAIRDKVNADTVDLNSNKTIEPTVDDLSVLPNSRYLLHWASMQLADGTSPVDAEQVVPFYVRNNVAERPKSKT